MTDDPFSKVTPIDAHRRRSGGGGAEEIELTEWGVSQAFVARHGHEFRYDHEAGTWFYWERDHWAGDRSDLAYDLATQLVAEASGEAKGGMRISSRKSGFTSGALRIARSKRRFAVTRDYWNPGKMVLGCPGVTVDLATGKSRAPDPEDRITRRCGVAPAEGACPRWHTFLVEALGDDEELLRLVQVMVGYMLTGRTIEHVLFFVYGGGGNGKSVFLNVIRRILGDYAVTASMDTFIAARGDRHPTDLAMLEGARLVSASETEEGRHWAESRLKQLTGGDPITARFMRGDFFTYQPEFKLMIVGNHQPVLRNVDEAMRRRFRVVPFTRKPKRIDHDLEEKLFKEAPQILAWAIRGCLEWQEQGLPMPEAVRLATEEYFSDQDLFSDWISERCALGDHRDYATPAELYASWKSYSETAGEHPGTAKRMASRLRALGLEAEQLRIDGRNSRIWRGVRVKSGVGL